MNSDFNKDQIPQKMEKTISSFKKDLGSLRTGRANPAMLDLIRVEVYGQKTPLNQLATITVVLKTLGEKRKFSIRNIRR